MRGTLPNVVILPKSAILALAHRGMYSVFIFMFRAQRMLVLLAAVALGLDRAAGSPRRTDKPNIAVVLVDE